MTGNLLLIMLPGAMVGITIGWLTAAWVTEHEIRLIVGLASVGFALLYWFRHRRSATAAKPNILKGGFWGGVTGFTSFVSHAGGPPFQIYAAPLRLDPRIFAGSSVIFFAVVNAVKVVPYFFLGQFSAENLLTSAILLPDFDPGHALRRLAGEADRRQAVLRSDQRADLRGRGLSRGGKPGGDVLILIGQMRPPK